MEEREFYELTNPQKVYLLYRTEIQRDDNNKYIWYCTYKNKNRF